MVVLSRALLHEQDGMKFYYLCQKNPSDDILESLYRLRVHESAQLKTVLELYDMEIHQKISVPNYQKLKTMVKRSINQKLRLRNFDARHWRFETGAVVKSRKGKEKGLEEANSPGETRCQKSWDRFEEYDSLSLRFVKQVSGKRKGHRLEKHKSKILISEVPTP